MREQIHPQGFAAAIVPHVAGSRPPQDDAPGGAAARTSRGLARFP